MEKRPIAMKCNKKQFRKITRKLNGLKIVGIGCFDNCTYLTNNCDGEENVITNIPAFAINYHKRKIYDEWNENIFLEACGIEVEKPKDFTITKEQIKTIYNLGVSEVRNWFPSVFEEERKELVAGKWYKDTRTDSKALFYLEEIIPDKENGMKSFGFTMTGGWTESCNRSNAVFEKFTVVATNQEVEEALIKEAVSRGFKEGVYFNSAHDSSSECDKTPCHDKIRFHHGSRLDFGTGNGLIFCDGKWAEIIPTITKQEAEQKLNCKII